MNRKVSQSSRKVPQSFKIYLCETLRFTLRNFAVKKKAGFNCVTPELLKSCQISLRSLRLCENLILTEHLTIKFLYKQGAWKIRLIALFNPLKIHFKIHLPGKDALNSTFSSIIFLNMPILKGFSEGLAASFIIPLERKSFFFETPEPAFSSSETFFRNWES